MTKGNQELNSKVDFIGSDKVNESDNTCHTYYNYYYDPVALYKIILKERIANNSRELRLENV